MAGAAPEAMVATGVRCAVADRRCIRLRGRRRSLARGPALPDQSHRHRRAAAGRAGDGDGPARAGFGLVDAARAALTAADAVAGAAETGGTVFRCRLVRALPRLRADPAQRA
ncbi:hypothetical protein G6F59_013035 [Rhizopus arrhizus]|nr:hypothetical protein G6F59_013035 [Rhizopus arrhizus]